jgi:hypothetical protein
MDNVRKPSNWLRLRSQLLGTWQVWICRSCSSTKQQLFPGGCTMTAFAAFYYSCSSRLHVWNWRINTYNDFPNRSHVTANGTVCPHTSANLANEENPLPPWKHRLDTRILQRQCDKACMQLLDTRTCVCVCVQGGKKFAHKFFMVRILVKKKVDNVVLHICWDSLRDMHRRQMG